MKLPESLKFNKYADWLNLQTLLLLFGLVQIWVLTFYYKTPSNEWISWIANDGSKGAPYAFGQHYFGDYLAMHEVALARDISAFGNSYPPLGVIPFWILSALPYRLGLYLWFAILVFALTFPIIHALRKRTDNTWMVSVAVFSMLTVPAISVLDRANSVGLLTLFLYLFYINIIRGKEKVSGFWLGLAIGIKIYPLVILPFLLVKKRFKLAVISFFYAIGLNLLSTIIWHRGDPVAAINASVRRIASAERLWVEGHGMYVSAAQISVNVLNKLGWTGSPFVTWIIENYQILSLLALLVLLIGAVKSSNNHWIYFALASIQVIPTGAFSYYRVWAISLIAIIILNNIGDKPFSRFDKVWLLACSLNLTILTFLNLWPINAFPTVSLLLIFGSVFFNQKKHEIHK